MAKTLNFQTMKKSYLNVTLIDGTVLMIGTPTKKVYDDLKVMDELLNSDGELDELYKATASLMSCNKAGKQITVEYLERIMDLEDVMILYNSYMEFISELANQKN